MEAMAGGPHQHGLALDGTHTSDFLLVGAVQEKVLGGQKASIAERRKYYAAKRMERMNGGQGGPNAGTEKLRAKMQEAQRGEGEAPVTFRDKRAHYAAKRMEVVARDDKLQQAMQININKGEARVGAYTAKARHRMPKVGLNLERVSKSKEKDDDERSDRIAGAKDKSVAKDGPQSSRRFKATPQGKHVSRLTVQSPSSVMQTDVRDLDTEHIGMIVATTLDGLTVDGGPTPSCNDLIEAAQKTLSAMGVTGVLFNRKKEIEMLYFQLVEEDGPATPRSARGPEVSADVFQLTYDQIGLIVATTLDGLTAPSYDGGPPKPPPTCSELIAAAQTTLTAMGVGGVLAKRREEIELVYLELTAEEEESDIPTGLCYPAPLPVVPPPHHPASSPCLIILPHHPSLSPPPPPSPARVPYVSPSLISSAPTPAVAARPP